MFRPDQRGPQAGGAARPKGAYHVEALAKGLRILGLFSEQRPAMKLTDIVAETGLPMPTAYRPARKVLTLGFSALRSLDLVQLAEGPLRRLVEATGQRANLRTR